MMDIAGVNIDVGQVLSGAGQLLKDIRTAITGKEPLDQNKQAEINMKLTEIELALNNATIGVALSEAQSQDKWTSRARPSFMYVIYIIILCGLPVAAGSLFSPTHADAFATGFGKWLDAIPDDMWWLFGAGYLGYGAFRSFEKWKAPCK